jgi:tRNA (Thr-GGU) A37 N-methylase
MDGTTIHICDVDVVDGTPLLDIKPYVPEFDSRANVKIGWLEKGLRESKRRVSDGRF